jgi:hypothetical protein
MDWTAFEKNEGFLGDIPVEWNLTEPQIFKDLFNQPIIFDVIVVHQKHKFRRVRNPCGNSNGGFLGNSHRLDFE